MTISISCSGAQLLEGSREERKWGKPEEGILTLGSNKLTFLDWEVPYSKIVESVMNTESVMLIKNRILIIDCGADKFQFFLHNKVNDDFEFPFRVQKTNSTSSLNKWIYVALGLMLLSYVIKSAGWLYEK